MVNAAACAEGLRRELGIQGFPGVGDLERVFDLYADHGRLIEDDTPRAYVYWRRNGRAVVVLPAGLAGWDRESVLAEEVGHWIREARARGGGTDAVDDREYRRVKREDRKAEFSASDFRLAWLVPERLIHEDDNTILSEVPCLTAEELRQRRAMILR